MSNRYILPFILVLNSSWAEYYGTIGGVRTPMHNGCSISFNLIIFLHQTSDVISTDSILNLVQNNAGYLECI